VEWEGCNETIRMLRLAIGRDDLRKAGAALETLEGKITAARETVGRLRQEAADREWRAARMATLRAIQARLGGRRDRLSLIEQKFSGDAKHSDGFKEWVYRNKVIPLLEREVNQFLAAIDPIRLRIEYRGKRLVYTVLDRGNAPTLDNCSGYQKYIVNLAMRAGLSRISAVGQHISALLIDEGFVAMDSVNIQKTREILRSIMEYCGHRHLVLMSHLDVIRDSADVQVNIARREPFSQIQFGAPYPELRVRKGTPESSAPGAEGAAADGASGVTGFGATPKKRGRPKKIVAAATA
jgi:DNA repair exonuclease SbcCD ATPase subunit